MSKITAHNSTFAIGGVSCSADSLVVAESFVLRINICANKPAHRKSAKRYVQLVTIENEKTELEEYIKLKKIKKMSAISNLYVLADSKETD